MRRLGLRQSAPISGSCHVGLAGQHVARRCRSEAPLHDLHLTITAYAHQVTGHARAEVKRRPVLRVIATPHGRPGRSWPGKQQPPSDLREGRRTEQPLLFGRPAVPGEADSCLTKNSGSHRPARGRPRPRAGAVVRLPGCFSPRPRRRGTAVAAWPAGPPARPPCLPIPSGAGGGIPALAAPRRPRRRRARRPPHRVP